jgi:UDP-2,3-diacylglucosamine pyrophosphatase LpxH
MKLRYRTVFLSDLHLGSRGAKAREVAQLLKRLECDTLYLVGDIIDMWRLRKRWYWPAEHNEVVRRLLKLVKHDTRVVFIPGNHDEHARQYHGVEFGGIEVQPLAVHTTADGRKLLVTHGDQYDLVVKHHRALSVLGAAAYDLLIRINLIYNRGRALMGLKYWSLSKFLKLKVKHACTFISRFEETLVQEARRRKVDGVVCGHVHQSDLREPEGDIAYYNCGDWVECCTMLVEHRDGRMEILDGLELLEQLAEARELKRARKAARRANDVSVPPLDDDDVDDANDLDAEPMRLPTMVGFDGDDQRVRRIAEAVG